MIVYEDELMHEGVKRRSGRYPWGSGEDPYQHEDFYKRYLDLKNSGFTEKEIADSMGFVLVGPLPLTSNLLSVSIVPTNLRGRDILTPRSVRSWV